MPRDSSTLVNRIKNTSGSYKEANTSSDRSTSSTNGTLNNGGSQSITININGGYFFGGIGNTGAPQGGNSGGQPDIMQMMALLSGLMLQNGNTPAPLTGASTGSLPVYPHSGSLPAPKPRSIEAPSTKTVKTVKTSKDKKGKTTIDIKPLSEDELSRFDSRDEDGYDDEEHGDGHDETDKDTGDAGSDDGSDDGSDVDDDGFSGKDLDFDINA